MLTTEVLIADFKGEEKVMTTGAGGMGGAYQICSSCPRGRNGTLRANARIHQQVRAGPILKTTTVDGDLPVRVAANLGI